jgi:hypothetical protein
MPINLAADNGAVHDQTAGVRYKSSVNRIPEPARLTRVVVWVRRSEPMQLKTGYLVGIARRTNHDAEPMGALACLRLPCAGRM